MDKDAYTKQLETENAALKHRIQILEKRLAELEPPGMSVELPRRRRKKRGGQKGHSPHLRTLLPSAFVKEQIILKPERCSCGSIPPIVPEVIEYVQPIYQCKGCGAQVYHPLPDDAKRQYFGPGVLAIVGILTGYINTSKRKALALMNEVFSVPMSLGSLIQCEAQLAEALKQPYSGELNNEK